VIVRDRRYLRRTAGIQAVLAVGLAVVGVLFLAGVWGHRNEAGIGLLVLACFDAGVATLNWRRSRRAPA
jgi:drug/metabolite transporter (DMT)-like permease